MASMAIVRKIGESTRALTMETKRNDNLYLFLDIDGVLCPKGSPVSAQTSQPWAQGWAKEFDDECLTIFEREILRSESIRIVISSNWRKKRSLEELRGLFSDEVATRIVGVTPILQSTTRHYRYNEVRLFFKQNKLVNPKWVAVEDDDEHFPRESPVVITQTEVGFDRRATERLRRYIEA